MRDRADERKSCADAGHSAEHLTPGDAGGVMAANPYDRERLWRSTNPPWGVVRAVLEDDQYLVILDDLNGDYVEIELTVIWRTDQDQDDFEFSRDDAGFPDGGGAFTGGDDHRYDCLYGREQPGTVMPLVLGDQTIEVTTNTDGWWFCVIRHDDDLVLHLAY